MNRNIFQKHQDSTLSESQQSDYGFEFSNMQSSNTITDTPPQARKGKGDGLFNSIVDDEFNSDIESHKLFSDYVKQSDVSEVHDKCSGINFNKRTENVDTNNMISEIKINWIESNKSIEESHFQKRNGKGNSRVQQMSLRTNK